MTKSESKYFNTAVLMNQALIELLNEKDFEFITVKELCQKACVNRSTFYLHYETMNDLIGETANYMFNKFMEYFKSENHQLLSKEKINNCDKNELVLVTPEYLVPYLVFIRDNAKTFRTLLKNAVTFDFRKTYTKMMETWFSPILSRFKIPPEEHNFIVIFYIRGIIGVIQQWLENSCKESVSDIVKIILRCTNPFVSGDN